MNGLSCLDKSSMAVINASLITTEAVMFSISLSSTLDRALVRLSVLEKSRPPSPSFDVIDKTAINILRSSPSLYPYTSIFVSSFNSK